MLDSWLKQESFNVYVYSQLLQMVIVMTVVVMCSLRKGEEKNLTKASKIVSMPEVRKFKLDLSEKQQQEVDVDLDAQLDDIGCETPAAPEGTPEVVSTDALQKTKRKDEGYKEEAKKEESTQSSLKKRRKPRRSIHSQSGSKITKELKEKQWEQSTGENEVLF
ncbi:unnamed protein product [Brugia pahangi]|uniref:BLVR domain-containing protein n=1 Tax=Brugia pahangi TaxID=6280 RepID=A0A0N4TUN7_BRUPA|nr:unnamed protein product [Brugia pahangi]